MDVQKLKAALQGAAARGRVALIGHDAPDVDSVVSCALMCSLCRAWEISAEIVLPTRADEQTRRILPRFGLFPDAFMQPTRPGDQLVLLDHHQALHEGEICACIDHHPTAYPPEGEFVCIEPVGACALLVMRLMEQAGVELTRAERELVVLAMYLDTIALRSSKISIEERRWAHDEAVRLGLDEAWLEREGLDLADMTLPPQTLAMLGKKRYDFAGVSVCSTYVQTDAMTADILNAILDILRAETVREGVQRWVFLVHDPRRTLTDRYDLFPDGTIQATHYNFLASRGKVIMPDVERQMTEERHGGLADRA